MSTTTLAWRQNRGLIIAEDDVDDQLLIRDALEENGVLAGDVVFVNDGQELMDRLKAPDPVPGLILLDLNMPRMDGREALRQIKQDDTLRHIPIVVFTTSSSEQDVNNTYQLGSNTFFTKPTSFDELVRVMSLIKSYWLETALLAKH
ncbi:response regulator [Gilvimarinus agarilyticus]|uniref:response regulator n=1 Tax=Gilvimarinus agarilyticus TaxID=679259 RepID=UPI000698EE61|nr:response regulator [Gilvimarinus agarilyticus]